MMDPCIFVYVCVEAISLHVLNEEEKEKRDLFV